jgi:hypothetical protein
MGVLDFMTTFIKKITLFLFFALAAQAPMNIHAVLPSTQSHNTPWTHWAIIATTSAIAGAAIGWLTHSWYKNRQTRMVTQRQNELEGQNKARTDQANTALFEAVCNQHNRQEEDNIQTIHQAVANGADVNALHWTPRHRIVNRNFNMPLLWHATRSGQIRVTEALINHRADINTRIDLNSLWKEGDNGTKYLADSLLISNHCFGASHILTSVIVAENEARTQGMNEEAHKKVDMIKLLLNNGATCPTDLPLHLKLTVFKEVPKEHLVGPQYYGETYLHISKPVEDILVKRLPQIGQQRYLALCNPVQSIFKHDEESKRPSVFTKALQYLTTPLPQN